MLRVDRTIISQYVGPTLRQLIHNMDEYLDPRVDFDTFYRYVWNVDTAVGFGLDILGRIVGVGRVLRIPNNEDFFGYRNDDIPPDWQPWNQGVFFSGTTATQAYTLPDDTYRTLILTKALANIAATTARSLNQLIRNLFPNRGRAYVVDEGAMSMRYVFEFSLTAAEYAILTESGVMPHPAGVKFSVSVIPAASGLLGFAQQGTSVRPFGFGTFYRPPGV